MIPLFINISPAKALLSNLAAASPEGAASAWSIMGEVLTALCVVIMSLRIVDEQHPCNDST